MSGHNQARRHGAEGEHQSGRADSAAGGRQCGPQIGVPPSLEQVPFGRLSVDPAYQRATDGPASQRIIAGMVKRWDWALAQPLMVARRADGSLWILDGQHRHAGASARGDIPFLPCVILSALDHTDEARTFVELNTFRQRLSQAEVFHGMLAAGDAHAIAVQQLLDETGWKLRRISGNTAIYKAGDLECAPMLTRALARRGEDPIRFALIALRTAYLDRPVRVVATLLKALFAVWDKLEPGTPFDAITDAMAAKAPQEWINRGMALQEANPRWDASTAIASAIMAAAAQRQHSARVTPEIVPMPAPTPAPAPAPVLQTRPKAPAPGKSAQPAFGISGKGWCDQCDQLRSRDQASVCGDRFCKLRAFT